MTKLKKLLAMLVVGVMVVTTATPVMAAEQTAPVAVAPTAPIPDDGIVLNYYNKTFDVQQYTKYNPDLVTVFGSNTIMYPMHYVLCGIKEGRRLGDIWDSKAFVRNHSDYIWQTTLAGSKDWFDAEKYRTMYPDVAAAFGNDNNACLVHYLYYGAYEGRFSCGKYDPAMFAYRYPLATVKTNCAIEEFQQAWNTQLAQGSNATGAGGTGAAPSSADSGDSGSSSGGGGKKSSKAITVDSYTLRLTNGDDVKDINLSAVNPYKVANPDDNKKFKDVYAECFGDAKVSMVAWCEGKVVATQTVTAKKFKVDEKAHTATLNLNKSYWKKTFKSEVAMPEYFQITWIPGESGTELPEPDDQLGTDWTAMKCRIGDQIIPLPITVQGLIDAGWQFDRLGTNGTYEPLSLEMELPANSEVPLYAYGYNTDMQTSDEHVLFVVANTADVVQSFKDCIVYFVHAEQSSKYNNVRIPNGVSSANVDLTLLTQKYGEYNETQVVSEYIDADGNKVEGLGYIWKSGNKRIIFCPSFQGDPASLRYGVMPFAEQGGGDDTIDLGQDWTSMKLTIDGDLVQFPITLNDLAKLGWTVDENEAGTQIPAGEDDIATVVKGNLFITVRAKNETDAALPIEQCKVMHILVTNEDYSPVVNFPGGMCNKTSTINEFREKFGEPLEDTTSENSRDVIYRSGSKEFYVKDYTGGTTSWFYGYTDEIDDTIQITSCELIKVDKDGGESSVNHEVTIENDGGLGWNDVYASYIGDGTLKATISFNDGNNVSVDLDASNFTADDVAFQATLDLSKLNYSGAEVTVKDGVNTVWVFKYPNSGSGQIDVSGLGDDWKSMKFGLTDGTIVQLPVSVQSLIDSGWSWYYDRYADELVDPWASKPYVTLVKGNTRLNVSLWNPDNIQKKASTCIVYYVSLSDSDNTVVMPGNIHLNAATKTQVVDVYGDPGKDEYSTLKYYDGSAYASGTGSCERNYMEVVYNSSSERITHIRLYARVENNGMITELKDTTLSSDVSTGQFCIKSGEHIAIGDTVSDLTAKGYTVTLVTDDTETVDEPMVPANTVRKVSIAAPGNSKTIGGYVSYRTDGVLADGTLVGINHTMTSGASDILLPGNILLSKGTFKEMQAAWGVPTDTNSESAAVEGGTDYSWDLGTLVLQVYVNAEGKIHGIDFSTKN